MCRVDEEDISSFRELWQDGYHCWRLEDITENPKLGQILEGLHARPRLFFEIAQAFGRIKIAGPWVKTPMGPGDECFVRYEAAGWPSYAAKVFYVKEDSRFVLQLEGATSHYDSIDEAKETADRRLTNRGYHLVDLRNGD